MHFPPTVWGPFFWHTIHITALGYPEEPNYTEKRAAKEFYESLAHLIPCPTCKEHYKTHLHNNPITPYLDKRSDLIKWTILIHNTVNKMLKKHEWTEAEIMAYYNRLASRNRSPVWTHDDMKEVDLRSFIRGMIFGGLGVASVVGVTYLASKYYDL
jgi:hypothetical protein